MQHEQRRYWSFFWPLALTGFAMILAAQFKNGILGRYPEALSELAIFALASSIFRVCNAGIIFVPAMANVLSRDEQSASICFRFICGAALTLSAPMLLLGFTPLGEQVIPLLFAMSDDWLQRVIQYVQLLSPMILINAVRQYYTGLLIQSRRTGWVTSLNVLMLTVTILVLLIGFALDGAPVLVISLAHVIPAVVHLSATFFVYLKQYEQPAPLPDRTDLAYRAAFQYFYPVAITSTMFAFSRPVIYHYVSYAPNAAVNLAILRVVFDFTMVFYNVLNQFRHLFVTFGREDKAGVCRFMIRTFVVVLISMLVVTLTPLHAWCLHYLIGIQDMQHIQLAQEAMLVLCAIPLFMTLRNYYHGVALIEHKTGRMGLSGVMRIVAITAFVSLIGTFGGLNHITGAMALLVGFMAESISMYILSRAPRHAQTAQEA